MIGTKYFHIFKLCYDTLKKNQLIGREKNWYSFIHLFIPFCYLCTFVRHILTSVGIVKCGQEKIQ